VATIGVPESPSDCARDDLIRVLVVSQHDLVRSQLIAYLRRSLSLTASGARQSVDATLQGRPDVVVLDLSRLGTCGLRQALDAIQRVGARLIALASMRDPAEEEAVVAAGGTYRLKSAGADGLADVVLSVAGRSAESR